MLGTNGGPQSLYDPGGGVFSTFSGEKGGAFFFRLMGEIRWFSFIWKGRKKCFSRLGEIPILIILLGHDEGGRGAFAPCKGKEKKSATNSLILPSGSAREKKGGKIDMPDSKEKKGGSF